MSRHQNQNTIQELLQNCADCLMRAELIAQPVTLSSHSSESGPGPRWFLRSSHPCHSLHIPVVGSLTLLVSSNGAMVLSDQTRQGYYLNLFSVASNDATDWANYKRKEVWFGSWVWPKLRAASGDDLLPGRVPRWQKASHGNKEHTLLLANLVFVTDPLRR